jgi:hypothetical protein
MTVAHSFDVRPVRTARDWRAFHRVQDSIDRHDPAAVRLFHFQRRLQLDVVRNPFYEHAEREAFLAFRGGQAVGRICAIVDRLHQEHYGDSTGFFGFFAAPNDPSLAQVLLDAAADWLRTQGCSSIRGPVNPSMKSDFGVLVSGHEFPPYVMMGHTPAYYAQLLASAGFSVIRSFVAFALDERDDRKSYLQRWDEYEASCQRIRRRFPQIEIRQSNRQGLESDIRRINRLGDEVRSEGWGFVPFTPAELEHVVRQLKRILHPEYMYLATIGGRLVGYLLTMPDLNDALRRAYGPWDWLRLPQVLWWLRRTVRLRIFGLGVEASIRHTGLAGLLIKRLFDDHQERFRGWELGWVDSENVKSIRAIQRFIPVRPYKKYELYQRAIQPRASGGSSESA